jgi:hypothetical protein
MRSWIIGGWVAYLPTTELKRRAAGIGASKELTPDQGVYQGGQRERPPVSVKGRFVSDVPPKAAHVHSPAPALAGRDTRARTRI